MGNIEVCCSSCGWKPQGQKLWLCTCGTRWDAFNTAGVCPCCSKDWEYIQCVEEAGGCNVAAPVERWYKGLDESVSSLIAELNLKKDTVI